MNWLDIVLLLILAASVVTSFRKGLSREIIKMVAVVLGLVLGCWFYGNAAVYTSRVFSSRLAANFAGFLLVFGGVVLLGSLMSWVLGKFLRVTGLSIFDHVLGAVFGVVRGVLIGVALIMAVLAFSREGKPPRAVVDSRLAPYVADGARVFVAMAPQDLKRGFHKTYGQARDAWRHTVQKEIPSAPEADKKR